MGKTLRDFICGFHLLGSLHVPRTGPGVCCIGDHLVHEGSSDVGQLQGLVRERQTGPYLGQVRRCLLTQSVLVNIQNTVSVFKVINIYLRLTAWSSLET